MTKWMESRGTTWNRWDHLYKVKAYAKVDGQFKRIDIPLSSCVFRTVMKKCRTKVRTQLEESRQSKCRKMQREKARRASVNEATSLPRQEADKRIEDKMDEKLQPLLEKVRSLQEQLRKNGAAPTAADQDGADARSETKKRKKSKRSRATEGAEACSEGMRRTRRPATEQMEGSSTLSRTGCSSL